MTLQIKRATRVGFQRGNKIGFKHGHARSVTYRKWSTMISRCRLSKRYVANGIMVCKRWRKFENFLADMGECPAGMELDRKKNHVGYSKCNCRWVTRHDQQRNKTNSVIIEFRGKSQCARDWASELGIHYATLLHRLHSGWSIEQAFTMVPKFGNRKEKV